MRGDPRDGIAHLLLPTNRFTPPEIRHGGRRQGSVQRGGGGGGASRGGRSVWVRQGRGDQRAKCIAGPLGCSLTQQQACGPSFRPCGDEPGGLHDPASGSARRHLGFRNPLWESRPTCSTRIVLLLRTLAISDPAVGIAHKNKNSCSARTIPIR